MDCSKNLYIGSTGSGKTFRMKKDICKLSNDFNNQIFIFDLYNEYSQHTLQLMGKDVSFIKKDITINPFDLYVENFVEDIVNKFDFILGFLEIVMNRKLNHMEKSYLDEYLRILYTPYIKELKKRNVSIDRDICPTLQDFHDAIKGVEVLQEIYFALEIFTIGKYKIFDKTNFNTNNLVVRYDFSNLNDSLIKLVSFCCLEDFALRTKENLKMGVKSNLFIENLDIIRNEFSMPYFDYIWRKARLNRAAIYANIMCIKDYLKDKEVCNVITTADVINVFGISNKLELEMMTIFFKLDKEKIEEISNLKPGECCTL